MIVIGLDVSTSATGWCITTSNKKETVGDLQDRAREASDKRKEKNGYDPIQSNWFDSYAEKRGGKRHPKDPSGGGDVFEM